MTFDITRVFNNVIIQIRLVTSFKVVIIFLSLFLKHQKLNRFLLNFLLSKKDKIL